LIIITIDGLNWKVAKEYFMDLFPVQSTRMVKNNVRVYTNTAEMGSPTVVGLFCLWTGRKPRDFHPSVFARLGKIKLGFKEENYPIKFIDKQNKEMDTIFNYFDKCKIQGTHNGPCPYLDDWIQSDKDTTNESYFLSFTNLADNVIQLESEDLVQFREFAIKDWDLLHIHTGIGKLGILQPGPYEQCNLYAVNEYEHHRRDKADKKRIWINGMIRYKYVIQHIINDMIKDEVVIVTADHGTMLDEPLTPEQIDDVPLIVNKKVDLSDINYQWDIKKLILRLKEEYDDKKEKSSTD